MDPTSTPERKRRRPPTEPRPAQILQWKNGQKMREMARWTASVMADDELPPFAIKAAWALSFAFSAQDGRAWEKRSTTAGRFGLKVQTFKEAVAWLHGRGHIITAQGRVPKARKPLQITWPAIPEGMVVPYPDEFRGTVGPDSSGMAPPDSEGMVGPDSWILTDPNQDPDRTEVEPSGSASVGERQRCFSCEELAVGIYKLAISERLYNACANCRDELKLYKSFEVISDHV